MGVGDWFQSFCGELRLSPEKRGSIASRTRRIVGQLNHDLRSLDANNRYRFYVGSYGRETAIPSVSDVDLLYELPAELYHRFHGHGGNGQSALLAHVRASVMRTYPTSQIGGDGQVVVVQFADGVKFEILPAFFNVDQTYTFADTNAGGSWRECKPKQEMDAFAARDRKCNQNLVQLARMARAWRDRNGVAISGMLIDTLAYQFIATWAFQDRSYSYYDYLTRDFFDYLATQDPAKSFWTAPGSGSRVYGNGFQYKARQAQKLAVQAIDNSPFFDVTAKQLYREIYGQAFPI